MEKNTYKEQLIKTIQEKMPEAPHNWAEIVAEKMGKSVASVYAYARGEKGMRKGYPREVLKHLNQIIKEDQNETKKVLQ
jgi:hypothetical protein